jgi:hypothetical protein
MSMFKPITREELAKATQPMPDGWYEAAIDVAEFKTSAGGNPMFALKLTVYKPDGSQASLKDWTVCEHPNPIVVRKFIALCDAAGHGKAYDEGKVTSEMLAGSYVQVEIGTKAAEGEYPAKNVVHNYAAVEKGKAKPKAAPKPAGPAGGPAYTPVGEDDIPF